MIALMKFHVLVLALTSPLALLLALSSPMAAAFAPPMSSRPAHATTKLSAVDPSHLHDLPQHIDSAHHFFSSCAPANLNTETLASDAGYLFFFLYTRRPDYRGARQRRRLLVPFLHARRPEQRRPRQRTALGNIHDRSSADRARRSRRGRRCRVYASRRVCHIQGFA